MDVERITDMSETAAIMIEILLANNATKIEREEETFKVAVYRAGKTIRCDITPKE